MLSYMFEFEIEMRQRRRKLWFKVSAAIADELIDDGIELQTTGRSLNGIPFHVCVIHVGLEFRLCAWRSGGFLVSLTASFASRTIAIKAWMSRSLSVFGVTAMNYAFLAFTLSIISATQKRTNRRALLCVPFEIFKFSFWCEHQSHLRLSRPGWFEDCWEDWVKHVWRSKLKWEVDAGTFLN